MVLVVALCASHLGCPRRCLLLRSMIASVVAQERPLRFMASVSFEPSCKAHATALRDDFACNPFVDVDLQPEKRSQFQHYKLLCSRAMRALGSRTWCMFCDDDDFCAPTRCGWYCKAIALADDSDPCVHCNKVLRMLEPGDVSERTLESCWSAEGCQYVTMEYWSFCARLTALERFCSLLTDDELREPTCDVLFGSVLFALNRVAPEAPEQWVYAYGNTLGAACGRFKPIARFSSDTYDVLAREFDVRWQPGLEGYSRLRVDIGPECVLEPGYGRRPRADVGRDPVAVSVRKFAPVVAAVAGTASLAAVGAAAWALA